MRTALSSNHLSVDLQVKDAVESLGPHQKRKFDAVFPEWDTLVWSGSWVDAENSGVDPEYTSWVIDWIEANTNIMWEDGEPWLMS